MFFSNKDLYEKDKIIQNLEREKSELNKLITEIRTCNELYKKKIDSLEQEIIKFRRDILLERKQFDEEIKKLKKECLEIESVKKNRKLKVTTLADIKSELLQLSQDKGFYEYEYFFLKTDTSILSVIENTEQLLEKIKIDLEYYEEFKKLYLFKKEIFDSSFKMLMLLQMIDKESALDLQRELQKQRLEIETDFLQSVHNYNESFNFLIRKTNHKEDFYKTFTLYSCKEQQVLTEKDRKKIEMRDNTIINFYSKKYGEKMFEEQNMRILKENLRKIGIDIMPLTKSEIRQIINKRKLK